MEFFWLLVGIGIGAIATSACWFSWNYAKQKRNRKLRKRSRHVFKAKSIRSFKSWAQNIQKNIQQNYSGQFNAQLLEIETTEDRDERLLWAKIVELSPIGYIQVNQDNRLVICNQQAANMMGIANHRQ